MISIVFAAMTGKKITAILSYNFDLIRFRNVIMQVFGGIISLCIQAVFIHDVDGYIELHTEQTITYVTRHHPLFIGNDSFLPTRESSGERHLDHDTQMDSSVIS